ncbi:MAG: 4Fe-4S binding protein [Elusimicrobiota bacterium]
MPRGDGTGPRGKGPGTGRGLGRRAGNPQGGKEIGQEKGRGRRNFSVNWEPKENKEVKAVINEAECIGCEACVTTCSFGAISMNEKAHVDKEECTGCGECVSICPVDAINLQ